MIVGFGLAALTPVTIPLADPTVALDGALLTQIPPGVAALVNADVPPTHTVNEPAITGVAFTVATAVLKQPLTDVYEISVVPAVRPFNTPLVNPIVPTAVFELLQPDPAVAQLNTVVKPSHTVNVPVIGVPAPPLTEIDFVLKHVGVTKYVIVAVAAETPVTIPPASTDATPALLLLHVPPLAPCVNGVVEPIHTVDAPLMLPGAPVTVATAVA